MIKNGEIPKGLQILHECDNPSCVNPKHLFIGTNLDNIADRVSKGRSVMGENHPRAKLKVDEVVEIRKAWDSGISQRELAARFDVPASDISSIIRNKSWKQVGIVSKRNHSGGEYHPQSKLTNENVFEIRSLRSTGLTLRKIAARFNVSISRISLIARGLQWKHLLT
jgi:transposase